MVLTSNQLPSQITARKSSRLFLVTCAQYVATAQYTCQKAPEYKHLPVDYKIYLIETYLSNPQTRALCVCMLLACLEIVQEFQTQFMHVDQTEGNI